MRDASLKAISANSFFSGNDPDVSMDRSVRILLRPVQFGPGVRAELHALFQRELEERGVPFVRVSGSLEARMETAIRAIDALL